MDDNKRLEIGEKDFNILKFINSFGFVRKETLIRKFFDSDIENIYNSYLYRRIKKLKKYNYIDSKMSAYCLGKKGTEYLELMGVEILYSSLPKGEKIKSSYKDNDVLLKLGFNEIESRISFLKDEERKGHIISKIKIFAGVAWNLKDERFLIYRINKRFTKSIFERIINDSENSYIRNVVLVCSGDLNQFKKHKNSFRKSKLNKVFLIPNTELGFETLKLKNNGYFEDKYLVEFINKMAKEANAKIEDNRIKVFNEFSSNLMILDLKKEILENNLANLQKVSSASVIFSEIYMDYFSLKDTYKSSSKSNLNVNQNNRKVTISNFKKMLNIE